jgi:hypothetical protein
VISEMDYIEDAHSSDMMSTRIRSDASGNRFQETSGNRALETSGNRALETSGNRALETSGNRALETSGKRSRATRFSPVLRDPLDAPEFATLRALRRLFSHGGLPPQDSRSAQDDARIASFFTLQELLYILGEFRKAHLRGARCRLAVSENGRSQDRITIDIAIVEDPA